MGTSWTNLMLYVNYTSENRIKFIVKNPKIVLGLGNQEMENIPAIWTKII